MTLNMTLAEIATEFQAKGFVLGAEGDGKAKITGISAVETCQAGDLVFMDKKDYIDTIQTRRPAAVVTSPKLKEAVQAVAGGKTAVLVVPNVSLAHALIKQRYAGRDFGRSGWSKIHPSAVVHESAEIDSTAVLEPRVVIGARTKIGKNVRVMAGAVVENDVEIGDDSLIHPGAVIGYGCRLGREVYVGAGSVIGSEGYGFAQDEKRRSYPIPQTGIVVLEDRVRVGANCCIDRATYHETRVGAGTKFDNLCHVAHNVQIGQDCLLTAMLCVAGSTKIGNRVITSGQTGIIDHQTIADDVVLLHRAGVTKDIEKAGAYAGLPLQPLGDYMKNQAVMKSAVDLRKRIGEIEKRLGITGETESAP
jgi:UDP-3-O-[3-hydroxymyristoyl] glucosamine N-acyltransferase